MFTTTKMTARELVASAVEVKSLADAQAVDDAIASLVGAEYRRPLGDRWNNFGMVSYAGDFDHKVIEAVTNAQDAILEREATKRFPDGNIPYRSPREAAEALFDLEAKDTRERIYVELDRGGDADIRKITMTVSDDGCGMTPSQMTSTILQLGSLNKSNSYYQQGAFGLGVKSTFRNAHAAVVISRRAPEMGAAEDRVAVAVITWSEFGKGLGASYLTTSDWTDGNNPGAEPWSVPASDVDFPIGTKLILVEYQVKGFHRAFSGDNRAFQAVANTRLHDPVIPFRQISHIVKTPEPRAVYGLGKSLADDPPNLHGRERLPFQVDGVTFQLPIDWWVFPAAAGKPGGRDSRVAIGHVVSFTSSGQVHHHWDKARFKAVTGFNKVDDRVYVVVHTDELPITTRTRLFTPDRAALLPSEAAIRLEDSVAAALRELDELREINGHLQREAIESAIGSRRTRAVAQRISQAFHAKGFATGRGGGAGGRTSPPRPGRPKKLKLLAEPTELTGPKIVTVRPEDVRSITFWLDAKDSFMEKRIGTFEIECDHPDLSAAELLQSDLLNGRIRVNALIPEQAKLGSYTLIARVPEWTSRTGGLAGPLVHETTLVITDEPPAPPRDPVNSGGASGSGAEVALQWRPGIAANNAGFVEDVEAQNLAAGDSEYADLAKLGEQKIPTIVLNENYSELRKYLSGMRNRKGDQAVEDARGRYAAGVGVGLLVMHADEALKGLGDEQRAAISRAQARTALSLLPDFDKLMEQLDTD
jgi:hypothetical protein